MSTVLNEGLIYTTGIDAAGISANSIGGGGGDAGIILDMSIGGGGEKSNTLRAVFNIGGNGGCGGTGGDVSVTNRPTDALRQRHHHYRRQWRLRHLRAEPWRRRRQQLVDPVADRGGGQQGQWHVRI